VIEKGWDGANRGGDKAEEGEENGNVHGVHFALGYLVATNARGEQQDAECAGIRA